MSFILKLLRRGVQKAEDRGVGAEANIIPDLPGFGESRQVPQSEVNTDAQEADTLVSELSVGGSAFGLDLAHRRVFIVTVQRMPHNEIAGLQEAIAAGHIQISYHYARMPTYPIIAIKATILDNPDNPFWLEVFPDIGVYIREDRGICKLLSTTGGRQFCFHFYDPNGTVLFRAGYQMGDYDGSSWRGDLEDARSYLRSLGNRANFGRGSEQYKARY